MSGIISMHLFMNDRWRHEDKAKQVSQLQKKLEKKKKSKRPEDMWRT